MGRSRQINTRANIIDRSDARRQQQETNRQIAQQRQQQAIQQQQQATQQQQQAIQQDPRFREKERLQNKITEQDNRINNQQQKIQQQEEKITQDKAKGFEFWKSVRNQRLKQLDNLFSTLNQLQQGRNELTRRQNRINAGLRQRETSTRTLSGAEILAQQRAEARREGRELPTQVVRRGGITSLVTFVRPQQTETQLNNQTPTPAFVGALRSEAEQPTPQNPLFPQTQVTTTILNTNIASFNRNIEAQQEQRRIQTRQETAISQAQRQQTTPAERVATFIFERSEPTLNRVSQAIQGSFDLRSELINRATGGRLEPISQSFVGQTADLTTRGIAQFPVDTVRSIRNVGVGSLAQFGGSDITRARIRETRQETFESLPETFNPTQPTGVANIVLTTTGLVTLGGFVRGVPTIPRTQPRGRIIQKTRDIRVIGRDATPIITPNIGTSSVTTFTQQTARTSFARLTGSRRTVKTDIFDSPRTGELIIVQQSGRMRRQITTQRGSEFGQSIDIRNFIPSQPRTIRLSEPTIQLGTAQASISRTFAGDTIPINVPDQARGFISGQTTIGRQQLAGTSRRGLDEVNIRGTLDFRRQVSEATFVGQRQTREAQFGRVIANNRLEGEIPLSGTSLTRETTRIRRGTNLDDVPELISESFSGLQGTQRFSPPPTVRQLFEVRSIETFRGTFDTRLRRDLITVQGLPEGTLFSSLLPIPATRTTTTQASTTIRRLPPSVASIGRRTIIPITAPRRIFRNRIAIAPQLGEQQSPIISQQPQIAPNLSETPATIQRPVQTPAIRQRQRQSQMQTPAFAQTPALGLQTSFAQIFSQPPSLPRTTRVPSRIRRTRRSPIGGGLPTFAGLFGSSGTQSSSINRSFLRTPSLFAVDRRIRGSNADITGLRLRGT